MGEKSTLVDFFSIECRKLIFTYQTYKKWTLIYLLLSFLEDVTEDSEDDDATLGGPDQLESG